MLQSAAISYEEGDLAISVIHPTLGRSAFPPLSLKVESNLEFQLPLFGGCNRSLHD